MVLDAEIRWRGRRDPNYTLLPRSGSLGRRPEIELEGQSPLTYTGASPLYRGLRYEGTIRLIKLLPAEAHEAIEVMLVYKDIVDVVHRYDALSYTWGDSNYCHTIYVNRRPVQVRHNAYDFLRRLRRKDAPRLLWMDCVCINQDDLEERARQVRIMHHIYRLANSVIVWLGRECDDSAYAMEYTAGLDVVRYTKEHKNRQSSGGLLRKSCLLDELTESAENSRLIGSLASLIQRPWARRVWIQQEAVLCKNVQMLCGNHAISFEAYFTVAWRLEPNAWRDIPEWMQLVIDINILEDAITAVTNVQFARGAHLAAGFAVHPRWADHWRIHRLGPELQQKPFFWKPSNMLSRTSICEASDPRDKIYALLGIYSRLPTSLELQRRPMIDYNTSWQVTYLRTAQWLLTSSDSNSVTDVIDSAGRDSQLDMTLPSWVPDWRCPQRRSFAWHGYWSAGGLGSDFYRRLCDVAVSKSERTFSRYQVSKMQRRTKTMIIPSLELNAIMLDRITHKSQCAPCPAGEPGTIGYDGLLEVIKADLRYLHGRMDKYFTGEAPEDAYAATLVCNTNADEDLASPAYEREVFAQLMDWLENRPDDPNPIWRQGFNVSPANTRTAFAMTAHGIMSIVPAMTQVGDYVAAIHGVRLPVALRRVGEGSKQHYELLGSCYAHRMMRGRLWNLIGDFKYKYISGSEDEEVECLNVCASDDGNSSACETFPFNSKSDYRHVVRVLGKRRITLV